MASETFQGLLEY